MNYKERLDCNEYIPLCVINELERLSREVERLSREIVLLKKNKVTRTPIVPDRLDDSIISDDESMSSQNDGFGECPLGLPDPPPSHDE